MNLPNPGLPFPPADVHQLKKCGKNGSMTGKHQSWTKLTSHERNSCIYLQYNIYIYVYIILYILPRKTGTHTAKMELLNASDSVAAHYNSLMVPIPRRFQRPRPGSVRAATANLETKLETVQEMPQLYVVHPWCP